jgi:alcohol dehydrogenase (NADP+)
MSLGNHAAALKKFSRAKSLYTGSYLPEIPGKIIANTRKDLESLYRTAVMDCIRQARSTRSPNHTARSGTDTQDSLRVYSTVKNKSISTRKTGLMIKTAAYAAVSAQSPLSPHTIERREPGPHDVLIDILYCGVCHSDIHQVRDEWGGSIFPMVPGHEIVGTIAKTGEQVIKWKTGDTVGVGCFIDSCRECDACNEGEEQYCEEGMNATYNDYERDGKTPTYGGYSSRITVKEDYVLHIPGGLPLERVAPLLCAGITTYSPLRHFGVKAGDNVAVVGLGGLGHMGVKIAKAMGARVTVLSHSPDKRNAALALGADDFIATSEKDAFEVNIRRFDFILDTVSAKHDYNSYLDLLRRDGTMVLIGISDPVPLSAGSLIMHRRKLAGSLIGGIRETQEMLDFCAEHGVVSDVEVIPIQKVNEAYERVLKSDVSYRFVIDMASLKQS